MAKRRGKCTQWGKTTKGKHKGRKVCRRFGRKKK